MNRVYVRLGNEPMPARQRSIGTRLLSPFENRHFTDQKLIIVAHSGYYRVVMPMLRYKLYMVGCDDGRQV